MARNYQVVIFGATGYGGRLVAEYFVTHYMGSGSATIKFAVAGRNRAKLEELVSELKKIDPAAGSIDVLIGDSGNAADMEAIAEQADVVASMAGPYRAYGSLLVAACAKKGTSYVDLSGEAGWIKLMESEHHALAKETGARIVPGSGFDSIPSDVGTYLVVKKFKERYGVAPSRVDNFVLGMKGGFQGGTINTVLNEIKNPLKMPPQKPDTSEVKGKTRTEMTMGFAYSSLAKRWTAPFFMAPTNMPMVKRTNRLLGYADGLSYRECYAGSFTAAFLMFAGTLFAGLSLLFPPTRWLLERYVVPKSGDGPSREAMLAGHFKMKFVASRGDQTCSLLFKGRGDPGALQTTIMVAESAACLALEKSTLSSEGGVLTPVSAMGESLVARLKAARWSRGEEVPRILIEDAEQSQSSRSASMSLVAVGAAFLGCAALVLSAAW